MKIFYRVQTPSTLLSKRGRSFPVFPQKGRRALRRFLLFLPREHLYNVVAFLKSRGETQDDGTEDRVPNVLGSGRETAHLSLRPDGGQGTFCCENYGVHVWEEQGGDETIPGLTTSASRIDELMTLLVDHQVGPAGLRDVVEDWL